MAIHETLQRAAPKKATAAQSAPKSDAFAVIATGGKQYRVHEGGHVKIEKLPGDYKEGGRVTFPEVLLIDNGGEIQVGSPTVSGAKVEGEIVKIGRNPKVVVIKYKAKSNYFKKRGHKQPHFLVKISKISA